MINLTIPLTKMFRRTHILAILLFLVASITPLRATYFPTPLAMPDDSSSFFHMNQDNYLAASIFYEEGSGGGGFNGSDQQTPLGNMYSNGESFIAMLRNPQGTVQNNLIGIPPLIRTAPDLGGKRGIIDVTGHVYHKQITLSAGYNLNRSPIAIPGYLDAALYFPCVIKRFDSTNLQLRPFPPINGIDAQLKQYTNNIGDFLQKNGGLSSAPWQGSGIGDPTIIMRWNLPQNFTTEDNDTIRQLHPYIYLGLQIPVSKKRDEDQLFSLALGNDGHWGIPLGLGLDFTFNMPIKISVGLDFLWLLADTRLLRVKTDMTQTSLLLLNKANVQHKPGLTWRFNWRVEGDHLWHGLGARAGYEFIMHHNDTLQTNDVGFSSAVIGSVETAQEWYVNLLTAALSYDLSDTFDGAPMAPVIEGFAKFPLGGRHVVNANSLGFQVILRF